MQVEVSTQLSVVDCSVPCSVLCRLIIRKVEDDCILLRSTTVEWKYALALQNKSLASKEICWQGSHGFKINVRWCVSFTMISCAVATET